MPRVVGIDPGTVSIDVCGMEDGRVFLDRSVPAAEAARSPDTLVDMLADVGPLDLIAGPSGYGLPLIPIHALGERELCLAFLARPGANGGIRGLRALVRALRDARLPVVFTPGVIHLPTVPPHRKVNRIDLGTADKVCAAALAIHDQARRLRIDPDDTSFILVELGGAFTAVLAVDGGQIVDGQGGSSGPLGYRACGALDGEVACLLEGVGKALVFSGGAAAVGGDPDTPPETLAVRQDEAARLARAAFVEGVTKAVAAALAVVPRPREIMLSGRLWRVPGLVEPVIESLARFARVHPVAGFARVAKQAAQGAALIADGLAGGGCRDLVDVLRLREAGGTPLDHLYVHGAAAVRRSLTACEGVAAGS